MPLAGKDEPITHREDVRSTLPMVSDGRGLGAAQLVGAVLTLQQATGKKRNSQISTKL